MNKYKIKYTYDTGDSFKTEYGQVGLLEFTWENLEIAKENLQRIKEHYLHYSKGSSPKYLSEKKRYESDKELQKRLKEIIKKDWYVKTLYNDDVCGQIKLQCDNGNFAQITAPWCGHFERLVEAEIVIDESDMKITF